MGKSLYLSFNFTVNLKVLFKKKKILKKYTFTFIPKESLKYLKVKRKCRLSLRILIKLGKQSLDV